MAKKIQLRRDISINWENENPPVILSQGEIGLEYVIEDGKTRFSSFKIGDGFTKWNDLPYALSTNRLFNSSGTSYIEIGGVDALENIKFYNDEINTIDLSNELFEIKRAVDVSILSETTSQDIFTGALTVAGGVGIQGDINIAGKMTADSILIAQDLEVDVIGNLQGDVTGNLIGDIYSENAVKILDSGTDGTNATFIGSLIGNVTSSGSSNFSNITITGGAINGTSIGEITPAPIKATSLDVLEELHLSGNFQVGADKFLIEALTGNTAIAGTLDAAGDLAINTDKFNVEASTGNTAIAGTLRTVGDFNVNNDKFKVEANTGNTDIAGDLAINTDKFNVGASTGNTGIAGTLHAVGNFDINTDKFTVDATTGNTGIAGTLHAVGDFDVNTDKFTVAATTGNTSIAGTLHAVGDFDVNTDKFTVNSSTGNTAIAGTLEVTNAATLKSTLEVNNDLSVNTDKFNVGASTGNTAIAGTLHAVGDFDVNTDKFTVAASTGNTAIAGTLHTVGDFDVNTDKFTVNSTTGNTVVAGTLRAVGNFDVNTDKFNVDANSGNTSIAGILDVTNAAILRNTLELGNNLSVNIDKFTINASTGDTGIAGTLEVTNATTLKSTLEVNNNLSVNTDKFTVNATTGDTSIAGTLEVTNASTLKSTLEVNNDLSVNTDKFNVEASSGNTGIAGTLHAVGNFDINTDKFTVAASTGNTVIAGTLEVTDIVTLKSSLEVDNFSVNTDKFTIDSNGNTLTLGTLEVTDTSILRSTLEVGSNLSVNTDKFTVDAATGNTSIAGTLHAVGNFDINTDKFTVDAATGNTSIAGTLHTVDDFDVNTDKFTVDASTGNTDIAGTLEVTNAATLKSTLEVNNDLSVNADKFTIKASTGNTDIAGTLHAVGNFDINTDKFTVAASTGNTVIAGTLEVTNAATLKSTLEVNNNLSVNTDKFTVDSATGNTDITGTLHTVGNFDVNSDKFTVNASTGNTGIAGTLHAVGDFDVNTDKFTVAATTGNTVVAGTLHTVGNFDVNTDKFTVDATTGNTGIAGTLHTVGNFDVNTDKFTVAATTGNTGIAGTLHTVGSFDVNTDKFTVNATNGNTYVAGTLEIDGITTADRLDANELNVTTDVDITGKLSVTGTSEFTGEVTAGNISASTLETSGNVDITGNLSVTGLSEFTGDMTAGNISSSTLETSGSVNITGALSVTDASEFTGDMTAGNISASTLETSGNVDITGDLNVTELSTLDEVDIKLGNINNTVIGATTPTSASVTDLTATSIDIKNAGTLKFKEPTTAGPAYVGLKAPDEITTSYTLTLPNEKGIDGNILAFNTLGDKLEFISADLFGGGTINVSTENGHDANDGINKPVKTVKRALQLASGVVYDVNRKPNGKKLVVSVANGEYYEDNPIIIPDNVSVQGAGLRACNIRPLNANLDMLRVRNGCYFTGFTFRDNLNVDGIPQWTFDYAVSFDDPTDINCDRTGYVNMPTDRPSITISPYIQNCSIISFLGANGVLVDGNKVNAPNKPKNQIEVENPVEGPEPEQGKSMVANAFTMLSFGGTGWRVINDAYAQIVSCFQIFCLNGSYCQSGGYLSITNSATNFGKYALRASGYSANAFSFNRGIVVGTGSTGVQQTIQAIGFGQLPVQDYVLRFRSNAYKNAYLDLLENKNDLQSKVITWIDAQKAGSISPFTNSFVYNEDKCRRDVGLLVEAVANDVLTGGNSRSVEAGLSYANADVATLTAQKTQNIAAFNYLKSQALLVVADLGIDSIVADKFKIITDIITDPATAPVSVSFSNVGDITADYQDIQPIDYVNFNSVTDVNFVANVFNVTGHGLLNGQKVIYNNNSNPTISGLTHEQTYYVDFRTVDQFGLFYDDSLTTKVNILSNSTGQQTFIKNVKEFYVDTIVDSHTDYQKLILNAAPGVTYTFETGREILGITGGSSNKAYVYSYNTLTKELIVSLDYVTVNNVISRRPFNATSVINFDHASSPRSNINISAFQSINTLYTVNIKILPVTPGTELTNLGNLLKKQIWLHRPSIVNSSSHSWEYAGSGTDYNALPQNGGKGDPFYEQVSDLPGKVYTSGTNELGDFKVGNFIKAENKTGNVTFTNTVTIGALAALRLAVGNITVEEFSSDITLGDAETGGPKATRLSTQLAVRSFLENRLGDFIDKKVSTNNLAGAIPQLNSSGQLNSDLIPPVRTFISHRSQGHRSRLLLAETVPAVNILIGDISTETYSTVELTLDSPVTALDGTVVIQAGTGAKGVIIENVSSSMVITVGSYLDSVFNYAFNTTGTLTIGGDSTPSDTNTSVTPISLGDVQLDQNTNYTLSEAVPSQFLVLDPLENYNFTGITSVTGVNTQAIGTVTGTKYGVAYTLDNANLDGGSGYNSNITGYTVYKNIALTSITGSGTGARADITVTNGVVTNIYLLEGGSGYAVNNLLRADYNDIGGTYTTQFSIRITSIQKRLYVNIVGSQKFQASVAVPELISDANSLVKTINLTTTTVLTFSAEASDNDVDYINSRITIPNHGLENGDPVKYTSSPNVNINGLVGETIYYVKVYNSNTIELCDDYSIQNKITFTGSGTGDQSLTLSSIDVIGNTVYLLDHGFNTGDAVYLTGTTLPISIPSGNFYFIGSVTSNSFTLHQSKATALSSIDGQTVDAINLVSTGSGTADFKLQNIKIIDTISTSSKSTENWSRLSINPIDANNIISGLMNTSRLAVGAASSDSFLRGDRTWVKTIQSLKVESSSPLSLIGQFITAGTVKSYYGDVTLDVSSVAGNEGDEFYSNLGVVRLRKSQFEIGTKANGTLGNVYIKSDVINAGTVNGNNSSYLLDSVNHTIQPVNKGGTGLTGYTEGDILYANGTSSFGVLNIDAANKVMVSSGSAPNWTDNITLKGLTVNGNVNLEGGIVSINSGIVKIADKNIEVGAVNALSSLTGVIADVANSTSVTGMTSTAGITAGMVLTKVSGNGVFGPNARVVEVLNNNTIRVDADGFNTTGDITFNLGGATDDTANDGGIIVKGQTDKKLFWNKNSLSWTSSENMDLAVNKEYKINTTTVLSSTQVLGKGFTSSAGEIVTSGSYWARTFAFMGV